MLCIIVPEYQSAAGERANQRTTAEADDEQQDGGDSQESGEGSEDDERFLQPQLV